MRSSKARLGGVSATCCAMAAACCLVAGPAQAASTAYPAGGSTFSGGAQGWQVTEASCNVPTLCTASGGYDGADGNPPGSIAANTTIGVNLLMLFKSTVTLQSPDFAVGAGGDSTLHLDRQFAPGALVEQAPQVTYTVYLIDRAGGAKSELLKETITEGSAFTGRDHAVTVKAGHTYALSITAETSSTVVGAGLTSGVTSVRFDNVSLSVQTTPGGEGGGGGALTDSRLLSLVQGSLVGPAVLKGNKLSVKAAVPPS